MQIADEELKNNNIMSLGTSNSTKWYEMLLKFNLETILSPIEKKPVSPSK